MSLRVHTLMRCVFQIGLGEDTSAVNLDAATPAGRQLKKLVWERWCPINSVPAPF